MNELRPPLTQERVDTHHIYLPYYHNILDIPENRCAEEYDRNYEPYQLFVLRTRISIPIIDYMGRKLSIEFESIRKDNKMVRTVTLYDGDVFIGLNKEQSRIIQLIVDDILNKHVRHVALLNLNRPLIIEGLRIPSGWLRTFVSYYLLEDINNALIDDDTLLVDLSDSVNYLETYNKLHQDILGWIISRYKMGIFLSDAGFAKRWNLMPVASIDSEIRQMYMPTWNDNRLLYRGNGTYENVYDFLYQRSTSTDMSFPLETLLPTNNSNDITWSFNKIHLLAGQLIQDKIPFTIDLKLNVLTASVNTYERANYIANLIEGLAINTSSTAVVMIPLDDVTRLAINRLAIQEITHGLILSEDTIVYKVDDVNYPYIISILKPYRDRYMIYNISVQDVIQEYVKEVPKTQA